MTPELHRLGWSPFFDEPLTAYRSDGGYPGRIAIQRKTQFLVLTADGEIQAKIVGKLRFEAAATSDLPVVGDWVVLRRRGDGDPPSIVAVLPRKTKISRKVPGREEEEQILGSNIDVLFLVHSLDTPPNLRRLERSFVLAAESGVQPVILLNKADLCASPEAVLRDVRRIAGGAPVHVTSAQRGEGLEAVVRYLGDGTTGALLGPSGAGKSTIINWLLGTERLRTREVREHDRKGRHATTHRELVLLPGGGLLVDTPGLRELQLLGGGEGMGETFEDIEEIALQCRFSNCRHISEPGCAVVQAVEDGRIDESRMKSYLKLRRELEFRVRKTDTAARQAHRSRTKSSTHQQKRGYRR